MRRKTREKPPSVSGFLLQYRQELMVNHGKGGLKEKGVLQAEFAKADMRTKVYYITSDGEEFVREELNEFVKAIEVVMSLIEGGSDV